MLSPFGTIIHRVCYSRVIAVVLSDTFKEITVVVPGYGGNMAIDTHTDPDW